MFGPEAARGLRVAYMLQLGDVAVHARIDDGDLEAGTGPLHDADLIIEAGPALKALMAGDMSPRHAVECGGVRLDGDPGLLAWFTELFRTPPMPPLRLTADSRADRSGQASAGRAALTVDDRHTDPVGAVG